MAQCSVRIAKGPAHRQKPKGRWVALLVVALLAAACGSSSGDDAAEPTTSDAEAQAEESEAEPEEAEAEPEPAEAEEAEAEPEAEQTDPEPTQIRLAFVPATTGLLVNVAQEQGYFAENGLNVELMPPPTFLRSSQRWANRSRSPSVPLPT